MFGRVYVYVPASRGESAGNTEEYDLFAGSEGVDRDVLKLILIVEIGQSSVR